MAVTEKIEAYNIPQGPFMNILQAIASKKPGVLTHVGLKTFVDPGKHAADSIASARKLRRTDGDRRERIPFLQDVPD